MSQVQYTPLPHIYWGNGNALPAEYRTAGSRTVGTNAIWQFSPVAVAPPAPRRRSFALAVAIGHAVFFLLLALAGWLR